MRLRTLFCLAAIGTYALGGSAYGENTNLIPLLEAMSGSSNGYPLVRCAALYATAASLSESRGAKLTNSELGNANEKVGFFLTFAHLWRGFPPSTDGSVDESVTRDTDKIADLYQSHMEAEYSTTGSFVSPMISEDVRVCQALERKLLE
jgi:hypothetical protein